MLFSSLVFLFTFLPITLLVYYLVPRKVKNVVLLIASLIFYAWGEPVYIFLMLISILFNYFCGMDIALKAGRKSQVRSLIFTIVVNLFILGFFKYYGFIVTNLNAILPFYIPYRKLELPIGISFYTFQTLSYIIDVYRGNVDVQVNLIDFGTYVTMFPQLIAGPIVQYADVERQLRERKESLTKFGYGAWFFVMGLAKKVLLANTIGSIYENIAAMDGMSVVTAWLGCLAYTFQIYFDFSGYSDMAVGLGKMFGFEFSRTSIIRIFPKVYRVLEKMAYFAGIMVPRVCVYSAWRKQGNGSAAFTESSDCMVPDRSLARGKLELCSMGALLRSDPHY